MANYIAMFDDGSVLRSSFCDDLLDNVASGRDRDALFCLLHPDIRDRLSPTVLCQALNRAVDSGECPLVAKILAAGVNTADVIARNIFISLYNNQRDVTLILAEKSGSLSAGVLADLITQLVAEKDEEIVGTLLDNLPQKNREDLLLAVATRKDVAATRRVLQGADISKKCATALMKLLKDVPGGAGLSILLRQIR